MLKGRFTPLPPLSRSLSLFLSPMMNQLSLRHKSNLLIMRSASTPSRLSSSFLLSLSLSFYSHQLHHPSSFFQITHTHSHTPQYTGSCICTNTKSFISPSLMCLMILLLFPLFLPLSPPPPSRSEQSVVGLRRRREDEAGVENRGAQKQIIIRQMSKRPLSE